MECPFKSMDFYDFEIFQLEAAGIIEQVESLISYIKQPYMDDNELDPALCGLETILSKLKDYIENKGNAYHLFKEDFDKNRAFAEDCSQAKALRVDRETTRSKK